MRKLLHCYDMIWRISIYLSFWLVCLILNPQKMLLGTHIPKILYDFLVMILLLSQFLLQCQTFKCSKTALVVASRLKKNKQKQTKKMEKFKWSLKNGERDDVKRFVEGDGVDVNAVS